MSYLLTEIALEMLGYKFYDIEGNLCPTNFQSNGQLNHNKVNEENEESLDALLKIQSPNKSLANKSSTGNNPTVATGDDYCTINLVTAEEKQITPETQTGSKITLKKPLPGALKKILDREYERICTQLIKNAEMFLHTNLEKDDHCGNNVIQEHLANFNIQEKLNLQKEAQTMHTFRKQIEKSLLNVNEETFGKYRRTFSRQ